MSGFTDRRDVVAGGLLVVVGAGISIHSAVSYDMGTMRMMGAGLFPTVLGGILAVLGIVIAVTGRNVRGSEEPFDLRSFAAILASLAAFVFVARSFGMAPGIVALVFVAALAAGHLSLLGKVMLSLAMVAISATIFRLLFTLQLPLFRWPF
jgi:hypothetical protein